MVTAQVMQKATGANSATAAGANSVDETLQTGKVVSQAELAEYVRLRAKERAYNALRSKLLAKLEAGAPIEPGVLDVTLDRWYNRILSAKALRAAIGEEGVRELLAQVEPTQYRSIVVRINEDDPVQ